MPTYIFFNYNVWETHLTQLKPTFIFPNLAKIKLQLGYN